jgi:hypothetical protein
MTRNAPFTLQVEHDQVDTEEYLLTVNGVAHVPTVPVNPAGVQFRFDEGLPPGTYSFVVIARGPAGETPSDPFELVVAPGLPAKPRLVIVVG